MAFCKALCAVRNDPRERICEVPWIAGKENNARCMTMANTTVETSRSQPFCHVYMNSCTLTKTGSSRLT